jgi:tRNA threonylcarbamoyladenosine biosynthesis protein TsaE
MSQRFITYTAANEADMLGFGAKLASLLRRGDVLALTGDLGAGKTTLARGLIQSAFGHAEEVPSPTYTLVQTYDLPAYELWHCDLYRLAKPDDVLELGVIDMESEIVSLIEWPDKMGRHLSVDALSVDIAFKGEGREVTLSGPPQWGARLKGVNL